MSQFLRIVLLIALVSPLAAQTPLQKRAPAPTQYVLGPGDEFVLLVTDLDEIPNKPIRIDPDGSVDLPLVGRVQAAGLTRDQLKTELASKLSKYINNPSISISLSATGNVPVSVLGEVATPGVHQLTGSQRLLEVLSLSGGVKPDAGPYVIVTREQRWGTIEAPNARVDPATGSSSLSISLDALMSGKDSTDNILIAPNDLISVPKAELVYVVGDVHKAGGFPVTTHDYLSLLQALSLAEGLAPDSSPKHAHILRAVTDGDGTPRDIPIDISKILAGKAPDTKLIANDVLYVPHSGIKVTTRRAIEVAIGVGTGVLIYR